MRALLIRGLGGLMALSLQEFRLCQRYCVGSFVDLLSLSPVRQRPCTFGFCNWIVRCWCVHQGWGLGNQIVQCNWIVVTQARFASIQSYYSLIVLVWLWLQHVNSFWAIFLIVILPNVRATWLWLLSPGCGHCLKWDGYTKWKKRERVWAYGWRL